MDFSGFKSVDILEIYRRYCDIRSQSEHVGSRATLPELLKLVELRGQARSLIFYDLSKLMSHLNLMDAIESQVEVDSHQFTCFYDFVFFMCRENGQKNITVSMAIAAWKLVLEGRFRLLNQWCDFVEKHQKHNISEDTWQQVLAFSRCVHEDLGGYDPKGAWPVLIDEFADHMYSTRNFGCRPADPEPQARTTGDSFPGLKVFSGSKRKLRMYCDKHEVSSTNSSSVDSMDSECTSSFKRSKETSVGESIDMVKNGGISCFSSACAVEGSLSKDFAGLLSAGSRLPFDQKTGVSYT